MPFLGYLLIVVDERWEFGWMCSKYSIRGDFSTSHPPALSVGNGLMVT